MTTFSDIPPRLRLLMTVAAVGGLVFIAMGTLAGDGRHSVSLDKLVHAIGYGLLGLLVVMGVPPKWYLPALFALAAAGVGLEFAQKAVMPSRKFEMLDIIANTVGLIAGMCLGLITRAVWGAVQTELETLAHRKRLVRFDSGTTVFAQGEDSDCFYMIMDGAVEIRVADPQQESSAAPTSRLIATLGPGELLGEMGVIDDEPRSATAIATRPLLLYRVEREQLHPAPGEMVHPAIAVARALSARLRKANRDAIQPAPPAPA